ncbi:MAG: hypothetical protein H7176_05555 [Bdellovibrionales bacterium]|nr:hypothetical protein [Massilia sp.]
MSFLCAVVVSLAGTDEAQAARVGELLVRQGNGGVPCFTISEAEEMRNGAPNFQSITVSDSTGPGRVGMWSMTMPKQRTFPLMFHVCVPYAGRLPVLPQMPAAPLEPGRVYEVAIEARGPFAPSAPHSYRAHFCLSKGAGGVRTVVADSRQRYACGP